VQHSNAMQTCVTCAIHNSFATKDKARKALLLFHFARCNKQSRLKKSLPSHWAALNLAILIAQLFVG
jgi:hypothetical protein